MWPTTQPGQSNFKNYIPINNSTAVGNGLSLSSGSVSQCLVKSIPSTSQLSDNMTTEI